MPFFLRNFRFVSFNGRLVYKEDSNIGDVDRSTGKVVSTSAQ